MRVAALTPSWLSGGNWLACWCLVTVMHALISPGYTICIYKGLESSGLYYTYIAIAYTITKARRPAAFGMPGVRVAFVKADDWMKGGAFETGHPKRNYENDP